MNMHDNYLDTEDAAKKFRRAYTKWGQAVDGKVTGRGRNVVLGEPASKKEQMKAAEKLSKALVDLADMALAMRRDMRRRYGWKVR